MSISLVPLFYKIIKLDEIKSGIASSLFVPPEMKTFKAKVQLVNHAKIVIPYESISLIPLFGETTEKR